MATVNGLRETQDREEEMKLTTIGAVDRATWVRVWNVLWYVISFAKLATTLFCHFLALVGGLFLIVLHDGPLPAMSWHEVVTGHTVGYIVGTWIAIECFLAALYWRPVQYIATTLFVAGAILVVFS
jgi:hypothetical protein